MLASQKIIIAIAGGLVKKESYLKLSQSTLHGNVASFLVFQLHPRSARTCVTQNGEGAHFNTTYICIVSRLSQNQVESEASYMALLVNQGSIQCSLYQRQRNRNDQLLASDFLRSGSVFPIALPVPARVFLCDVKFLTNLLLNELYISVVFNQLLELQDVFVQVVFFFSTRNREVRFSAERHYIVPA